MTKGTLPREPLLRLWRTAQLQIAGETPVQWRSPKQYEKRPNELTLCAVRLRGQPDDLSNPNNNEKNSVAVSRIPGIGGTKSCLRAATRASLKPATVRGDHQCVRFAAEAP